MVNVLLGCTGSVASLKLPLLVNQLLLINQEVKIQVVITDNAKHFFNIEEIPENVKVYSDVDEWNIWNKRGDPVLHIELGKWADILLIAPLDANTLAKLSNGICDNLLTCLVRAWDPNKPLVFCPAMNTKMYQHPLTETQINLLVGWGYIHVPAIEKTLICGDTGIGAMAEVNNIVEVIHNQLKK